MTFELTTVGFLIPKILMVTTVPIGTDKKLTISITAGVELTSDFLS